MSELKVGQVWEHPLRGRMVIQSNSGGTVKGLCDDGSVWAGCDPTYKSMTTYSWVLVKDALQLKVGQRWQSPYGTSAIVKSTDEFSGLLELMGGNLELRATYAYLINTGWFLVTEPAKIGHVYASRTDTNELFEVLTEAPRLRSLRTGINLVAKAFSRDHVYLGPMPKIGDTWVLDGSTPVKITNVDKSPHFNCGIKVTANAAVTTYTYGLNDFLKCAKFDRSTDVEAFENLSDKSIQKLIDAGHLTPTGRIVTKPQILEFHPSEKRRYFALPEKDSVWLSRKNRYVTVVKVDAKVVRLRDTLTDKYLGFRTHEDFLRTYAQRLVAGEAWAFNGKTRNILSLDKNCVEIGKDEYVRLDVFLKGATFVSKGITLTQQLFRALRPYQVDSIVIDHSSLTQVGSQIASAFGPSVGGRWVHKEYGTEIEIVSVSSHSVVKKRVGSRTSNEIRKSSLFKYYNPLFKRTEPKQPNVEVGSVWVSKKSGLERVVTKVTPKIVDLKVPDNGHIIRVPAADFRKRYEPVNLYKKLEEYCAADVKLTETVLNLKPEVTIGSLWQHGLFRVRVTETPMSRVFYKYENGISGNLSRENFIGRFKPVNVQMETYAAAIAAHPTPAVGQVWEHADNKITITSMPSKDWSNYLTSEGKSGGISTKFLLKNFTFTGMAAQPTAAGRTVSVAASVSGYNVGYLFTRDDPFFFVDVDGAFIKFHDVDSFKKFCNDALEL